MPSTLTLQLSPSATRLASVQRLLRKIALDAGETRRVTRLYADTPRRYLHEHALALYLERVAGQWQQVLVAETRSPLDVEQQWSAPYAGVYDFTALGDAARASVLSRFTQTTHPNHAKRISKIDRCFEARLRVSQWRVPVADGTPAGVRLERGTLHAHGRQEAVAYLTLTHESSDRAALYALASQLSAATALLPSATSLSTAGLNLATKHTPAAVKAERVDLSDEASVFTAFGHIGRACLQHGLANRDGALHRADDPEYVHQLRVSIRRFRAALQLFRAVLPPEIVDTAVPPLRELMAVLGRSRDLDVLLGDITTPVLRALPDEPRLIALDQRLRERLSEVHAEAIRTLERPDISVRLLAVSGAVAQLETQTISSDMSVRAFADQRLRKRLKAVRRCAAAARADDPVSLHELRIAIKRLRYGLEFFSSLLPKGLADKVLARLATLQDELGQLNDLASAGALLMSCAGDEAALREAVTLVGGWHGERYAALLRAIPKHLKDALNLRLPRLSRDEESVQR
jgi:CHAD domain-containing protein